MAEMYGVIDKTGDHAHLLQEEKTYQVRDQLKEASEDFLPLSSSPETYIDSFVASIGQILQRNPKVERTFSLPSNPTTPGSFLLPSYPLATLPVKLTPTMSRRHGDPSLSMSNTWPNKRESSLHHRDTSPWRDTAITATGDHLSSISSPRPLRASLVTSSSTSSFRRALSSTRATTLSISPVVPPLEQAQSHKGQRPHAPGSPQNQQLEKSLHLDPDGFRAVQDPQEDDPLDMQEMMNSLCSLRNGAAKKRAKVSLSSPDPDSPDSAVRLDMDSQSQTSPKITSSASESGPSSLSSVANSSSNGIKTSLGNSEVPSAELRSSVSMDFSSLQGLSQRNELSSEVGVVGQRVTYSNGTIVPEMETTRTLPPLVELDFRNTVRGLKPAKGSQSHSSRNSPGTDMPEGAIGRDLHLNGSTLTSTKADHLSTPLSPVSPPGPQSPLKCFTPPHQPSPPTVPPNPRNLSRLRRAPSLSRTRPSLSHSSDELSPGNTGHRKNVSEPQEMCPFSKPDLALTESFNLLSSEDWEKKIEGLMFLRSLAHYHSDTLQGKLHDVCLCLIQEVKNRRSGVSRVAVCTMGDLYTHMQKAMDQELEGTAKALLQKAGETNAFIRQDVDAALDCMVQHCTPTRSINALLSGGISHLSALVRKCTAQHLANLVEKVGAARLLSGGKDLTERILPAVTKLAQDSSQETRFFGRRMLLSLSSHPDFDKILEKYIPTKDLPTIRDTVFTLKTKGLSGMPQSARGRRSLPGSGTVRASSLTREPLNQTNRESSSHSSCRSQTQSIADKTEYIKQISGLLGSKDFRERIKGIDQLVVDCQHNPNMVINSIFQVFDAFKARLQESNGKVNLHALESLQKIIHLMKDNLSQVVNILVPAIVDNHLNSKNNAIYSAAIGAINALILNLDNVLLLQPFCNKAKFLSGKAKVDLIEKVADLVTELYPRKPQVVEQKVLPLLWHLLGTSTHSGTIHGRGGSVRGATANLCQALHAQMGSSLSESAASQPANVHKGLNEFLRALT
ncbi:TOG array regulator of axonemal microtubules protein 1-like [Scophthalmus maximus]|uniref:TOG array regulator of axonemal microtubules protein 1-like n=1 Tax=Scophthalmus maximus TaxID=52904 RepID=UPI0015E0FBB0|nr:TOG array regulator of axonemal microtubules protein 1-like [Scophthalmus maximus]